MKSSIVVFSGNVGDNQLPMKKRKENIFKLLRSRYPFGIYKHHLDAKVVKLLPKDKVIKISRHNKRGTKGKSYKTIAYAIPSVDIEVVNIPYFKRKNSMDENGMSYRGKVKK